MIRVGKLERLKTKTGATKCLGAQREKSVVWGAEAGATVGLEWEELPSTPERRCPVFPLPAEPLLTVTVPARSRYQHGQRWTICRDIQGWHEAPETHPEGHGS